MRNLLTATAVAALLASGAAFPASAQQGGYRGGPPQPAPQAVQGPQMGPGGIPAGSYQQSCRNEQVSGRSMTAECRASNGRWAFSRLPYADCRADIQVNTVGIMTCGAITADQGRFVDDGPSNGGNRADNRGRDNNTGAAVAAGVIAGALLGGAPIYGDPHYGDPRYDPHYAQGGWGYGHRPGEWVAIRDRADWLNMRIDRAQREGRLSRGDARDLRRQLGSIEDMEARFLRDGRLDGRERADLDRRFDELQARIRFEADSGDRRDGDRRDDRYDRR